MDRLNARLRGKLVSRYVYTIYTRIITCVGISFLEVRGGGRTTRTTSSRKEEEERGGNTRGFVPVTVHYSSLQEYFGGVP